MFCGARIKLAHMHTQKKRIMCARVCRVHSVAAAAARDVFVCAAARNARLIRVRCWHFEQENHAHPSSLYIRRRRRCVRAMRARGSSFVNGRDVTYRTGFSRVAYRQFERTWLAFKCNHASILSI